MNVAYDEWVIKFDNDNNPEKAIIVVQALEGVLGKHIQENIEIFEINRAVMSNAEANLWS